MAIFDCDFDVRQMIPALRERAPIEGYKFSIGRYISSYTKSWKVTSPAEFRALADFNYEMNVKGGYCLVWLIFEDDGRPRSAATGRANAVVTREWIDMLNVPVGGLIAYTSDEDGPINAVCDATEAYFDGLKTEDGKFIPKRGLYASGSVAEAAYERGLIDVRWPTMSTGFSGTNQALRQGNWDMDQHLNVTYAGKDVDPDVLREGLTPQSIGCFAPSIPVGDIV
jgi:hypothetical protein